MNTLRVHLNHYTHYTLHLHLHLLRRLHLQQQLIFQHLFDNCSLTPSCIATSPLSILYPSHPSCFSSYSSLPGPRDRSTLATTLIVHLSSSILHWHSQ
jgi:hypothetical protein